MLVSLIVFLKPEKEATVSVDLGRASHALFLNLVQRVDGALAARLHEADKLKPFTVSSLRGLGAVRRGHTTLSPDEQYWLRFTSFERELSELLMEKIAPELKEITLSEARFEVTGFTWDPQMHLWAGRTTFEALAGKHLLGCGEPAFRVALRFASPTTFRSDGRNVPLPLPGLVFDSYLQKWNAVSSAYLSPEVRRFVEESMVISRYRLQTRLVEFGPARHVGFVGECRYIVLRRDKYWTRLVNLLAAFAFYCGTGHKTTMGLGQTRRIPSVSGEG
jgi:CRISPR-associated endoribonuclease Cas6